jgi:hypothetical protein
MPSPASQRTSEHVLRTQDFAQRVAERAEHAVRGPLPAARPSGACRRACKTTVCTPLQLKTSSAERCSPGFLPCSQARPTAKLHAHGQLCTIGTPVPAASPDSACKTLQGCARSCAQLTIPCLQPAPAARLPNHAAVLGLAVGVDLDAAGQQQRATCTVSMATHPHTHPLTKP